MPGTWFDIATGTCLECERGTYQKLYNKTSCVPCAMGLTTAERGANDITKCEGN